MESQGILFKTILRKSFNKYNLCLMIEQNGEYLYKSSGRRPHSGFHIQSLEILFLAWFIINAQ